MPAAGSLGVTVAWPDGTAAAGVHVLLQAASSWGSRGGTTDVLGRARFEAVRPGRYALRGDRGGVVDVEMGPDSIEVELVLPPGRTVLVRVHAASGGRVPDADVYLSAGQGLAESSWVGRSDAQGELLLPHVEDGRTVTVRKHGHEPSPSLPILEDWLAQGRLLEVHLLAGGASLDGRVLEAPHGRPLAGVRVRVAGGPREVHRPASDGIVRLAERPLPAIAVSGPDGEFRLDALHRGALQILVDHPGFARHESVVELPSGSGSVEVVLTPASPVRGRVLGQDGEPVAEALVSAGAMGRDAGAYCVSGPDGAFELRDLRPGRHVLLARAGRGRAARAEVEVPFEGAPVHLVLSGPVRPAGWVVDAAGAPVAGCEVTFSQSPPAPGPVQRGPWLARTDDQGAFWLEEDRDGWLHFWLPAPRAPFPAGALERRRETESRFVSAYTREQAAVLRVRCAVELAPGARAVVKLLELRSGLEVLQVVEDSGTAEIVGLPPGQYALEYLAAFDEARRGPTLELGAGEIRELPVLTVEEFRRLPPAR